MISIFYKSKSKFPHKVSYKLGWSKNSQGVSDDDDGKMNCERHEWRSLKLPLKSKWTEEAKQSSGVVMNCITPGKKKVLYSKPLTHQ